MKKLIAIIAQALLKIATFIVALVVVSAVIESAVEQGVEKAIKATQQSDQCDPDDTDCAQDFDYDPNALQPI